MTPKQLIDRYGSVTKAAYATGFTRQAIYKWINAGRIPLQSQWIINAATLGALKIDQPMVRNAKA